MGPCGFESEEGHFDESCPVSTRQGHIPAFVPEAAERTLPQKTWRGIK